MPSLNPPTNSAIDWSEYGAREVTWPFSWRDETLQPICFLDGLDEAFVRDWLGGNADAVDIHNLAGVPIGARVTVSGAINARIAIGAIGQSKVINRSGAEVIVRYQSLVHVPLSARARGKAAQVLKFHFCTSEPSRSGFGTDAVVRMVAACEKLGLESIEAILAGDGQDATDNSTGYYAWVAQGFNAALSDWPDYPYRPLPSELQALPGGEPVRFLLELFGVAGGPQWWRQQGSTVVGEFTVEPGSPSRKQLLRAMTKLTQERGSQ